MKNLALILMVLIVSVAFAQKNKTKSKNTDDISLVKAVIENETKAFFEIDREKWEDSWAHVPYAYWSFADTTDVNYFSGWEAIRNGFSNYFKTAKKVPTKISREWQDVRVNGNLAYARFTQKVEDNILRDEQAEVRVLEKINGQWKIIHVGVIARQKHRD